jgi:hypothetical protein
MTKQKINVPLDDAGHPDLQKLVELCGGYHRIDARAWQAFDRATGHGLHRNRSRARVRPRSNNRTIMSRRR